MTISASWLVPLSTIGTATRVALMFDFQRLVSSSFLPFATPAQYRSRHTDVVMNLVTSPCILP